MIKELDHNLNLETHRIEAIIDSFLSEFAITQTPIEVSFRALLPELKNIDRASHLIHSYPAKLLLHIPYFFLNNNIFSKPGDLVLDPFCGTGTVLLESLLSGRKAIGADANPLARIIAKVKTSRYNIEVLTRQLSELIKKTNDAVETSTPKVVNLNYWFNQRTIDALIDIKTRIELIENENIKDFFLVCFSNLIKKVSYADPRVSVPVRLNEKRFIENSPNYLLVKKQLLALEQQNIYERFESICSDNISRFKNFNSILKEKSTKLSSNIISTDARALRENLYSTSPFQDNSVNLIITSPPYAGAQKYIRSSSLNLGWLGLAEPEELRILDKKNIGRENYSKSEYSFKLTGIDACDTLIDEIRSKNALRAQIVSNYICEMQKSIDESIRVLRKNGYFIIIIGNNKVCNLEFNTQEYLTTYIESKGLKLTLKLIDDIKSYGLMTKRNKTADIISREWVLVFKK